MDNIDEYCKIMNIQHNEISKDPKQEFRYFCFYGYLIIFYLFIYL